MSHSYQPLWAFGPTPESGYHGCMHLKRVQLENIRGFREVDLDLRRPDGSYAGWTVLAGRNGSGKSTFLRAVALAITGPQDARALQESFQHWLHQATTRGRATLFLKPPRHIEATIPSHVALHWVLAPTDPIEPFLEAEVPHIGPWATSRISDPPWFLAGYGPFRRLTGHGKDAQRLMTGPDRLARLASLFREDASLIECVEWLQDIYLRRLEGRPGAGELEKTVLELLNDGLLPNGARVDHIDSDGLWVELKGHTLPLESLSDGYRTTAALVMDIVRHLHRAFDELEVDHPSDVADTCIRILHEGVVLIDEMEEHLHVTWQRKIGFWLKRHFPNIQFIVTTHSPFICQAADPGGLIRFPAPGEDRSVEHVSEDLYHTVVHGSLDDAVLTELFGLEHSYSDESEDLREQVSELEARLQEGQLDERGRRKLEELRKQLPTSPSTDVEMELRKLLVEG